MKRFSAVLLTFTFAFLFTVSAYAENGIDTSYMNPYNLTPWQYITPCADIKKSGFSCSVKYITDYSGGCIYIYASITDDDIKSSNDFSNIKLNVSIDNSLSSYNLTFDSNGFISSNESAVAGDCNFEGLGCYSNQNNKYVYCAGNIFAACRLKNSKDKKETNLLSCTLSDGVKVYSLFKKTPIVFTDMQNTQEVSTSAKYTSTTADGDYENENKTKEDIEQELTESKKTYNNTAKKQKQNSGTTKFTPSPTQEIQNSSDLQEVTITEQAKIKVENGVMSNAAVIGVVLSAVIAITALFMIYKGTSIIKKAVKHAENNCDNNSGKESDK